MEDTVTLYQQEQKRIEEYLAKDPDAFTPKRNFTYQQILEYIGITIDLGYLPQGYLNFYQQDFIVEEIGDDGHISSIELGKNTIPRSDPNNKTLYADMIKVGISTLDAINNITQILNIPVTNITYAGIKDAMAITSQRIAIRDIDIKNLQDFKAPGIILKNFKWGKGVMEKGALRGNRFTIIARTPFTIGEGRLQQLLANVQDGFYNFYYLQRFGSPRLLSHKLGKYILQNDYQIVIKIFMCDKGVQDVPFIKKIRRDAEERFGNWKYLADLFSELPYTFRLEKKLARYLTDNPNDFLGALKLVREQTTLWIYAYASYLFNRHLSCLIATKAEIPKELPLLLNPSHGSINFYVKELEKDGIRDIEKTLKKIMGYSPISSKNTCLAKITPNIIKTKIIDRAVIFCFELPPASYATTFLTHFFSIYRGMPIPEWVDQTKYDSKKLLGLGSIQETEKILSDYIFSNEAKTKN